MKRTTEILAVQKTEMEERLDYLMSIDTHICAAECIDDLREIRDELTTDGLIKPATQKGGKKKKVDEAAPLREYEIDGFSVLAGRNNLQNDRLLKRLTSDDIWLHTNRYHSSHVGIIANGNTVPDKVIAKAAEICAYYSQARGRDKVTVDYTLRKYVKKPPKANSGFVIYTDYSNIIVSPDPHRNDIKN